MIMNWQRSSQRSFSRLGVVVSKRVGDSVERSRTRRVLREAFRWSQTKLSEPVDMVLVARKMIRGASQQMVAKDLARLFSRADLLKSTS